MAISVLRAHGIDHGDISPGLDGSWSKVICDGLAVWNPDLQGAITCDFLKYDSLFEMPPIIRWTAGMVAQWISGASHRIERAISMRSMAKKQYDTTCKMLKHHGPYLPVILEACQEKQLSYEYRHGTQSYGAFTYSLAATLRESRGKKVNPSFVQLMDGVGERLKKLKYPQVPNLVGAREVLRERVP